MPKRQPKKPHPHTSSAPKRGKILTYVFIALISIFAYRYFLSPHYWLGEEPFNLILSTPDDYPVVFFSLNPALDEITLISFPNNLLITTVYGYGDYKVDSLLKLGQIEGLGSRILTDSLEDSMGLPVSGYINLDRSVNSDSNWQSQLKTKIMIAGLTGHTPLKDSVKFLTEFNQVRSDKVDLIDLSNSRLVVNSVLRDQSSVYKLDTQRLDGFIRNTLASTAYTTDQPSLAVINTTNHTGLAAHATRIMINTGVDVVSQQDNNNQLKSSKIIVSSQELTKTVTINLLKHLFASDIEVGDTGQYRADAVLLLGDDYAQHLTQKP